MIQFYILYFHDPTAHLTYMFNHGEFNCGVKEKIKYAFNMPGNDVATECLCQAHFSKSLNDIRFQVFIKSLHLWVRMFCVFHLGMDLGKCGISINVSIVGDCVYLHWTDLDSGPNLYGFLMRGGIWVSGAGMGPWGGLGREESSEFSVITSSNMNNIADKVPCFSVRKMKCEMYSF